MSEFATQSAQIANTTSYSRRSWVMVGVGLSGILFAIALYFTLRWQEETYMEEEFRHRSKERMKSIASQFDSGMMLVRSAAAYMQLNPEVTQKQFKAIADALRTGHNQMQAVGWNPRVSPRELAAHIASVKKIFPDYEVHQLRPDGTSEIIDAQSQELSDTRDRFVVKFIEPLESNRAALGLDIASEPVRREALYRACDTGEPIASARINLVQDTGSKFGTLLIAPVYRETAESNLGEPRREDVVGVFVGVYRIGDAVESAIKNLKPAGIDVHLFDHSASTGGQLLYLHSSRLRAEPMEAATDPTIPQRQEVCESLAFEFGDRQWTLYCTATPDFFSSRRTWLPPAAFGGALLVTFLIVAYVYEQGNLTNQLRREIEVRAKAEQQVRESEYRFRSLCEKLPVGIFVNDENGDFVFANELCLRLTGLRSNEAMSSGWSQAIHPDDRNRVVEGFNAAVQTHSDFEIENRFQVGGKTRWVHAYAVPRRNEHGDFIGYMGCLMDITNRKVAEAELICARDELRASEAKYRTIVDTTQEWIREIDLDGVHTFSNPAIERILGYTVEEVVGTSCLSLMYEEDRVQFESRLPELLNEAAGWTGWVIRWRHKCGGVRHLESNAAPIFDTEGRHIGYRGADRDITARVEAEQQLAEQQRALAHISRLSTMGEMVAGIAHEINQPLSAISNFAAATKNALKSNSHDCSAPIEEWLEQINSQAVRCGEIIRRLRRFVVKGDQNLRLVDLNEIVRESVALLAANKDRSAHSVECRLPERGPQVNASEVQLQQVLVNLLRNAFDSTQEMSAPKICVSVEVHGDCARLTVEDNGPGIQEQKRVNLFDPFYTTKPHGLGMGLAISRWIVEAHGGKLWLDSETPRGARFHIELPLEERHTRATSHG